MPIPEFANDMLAQIVAAPILIIEDNEINRIFIEKTLHKNGYHNLYSAENADEGLAKLANIKPELVILDIIMPGMNGFECCAAIRQNPEFHDLPVLVQTVITEPELCVKAFKHGATDFVSKPVYADELCARVKVHLGKRLLIKSLYSYKERVQTELAAARQLQFSILPHAEEVDVIKKQAALDVAAYFDPASEIGGDFWGVQLLASQQAAIWAADFSGHGVASALNSFRLQAHMKGDCLQSENAGEYLSRLNGTLRQLLPRGQFATMFYAVSDVQNNWLEYACAGAPSPIVLRQATGEAFLIDASGYPLSVSASAYETQRIPFHHGDTLILYSDALTESADAVGRQITENDLLVLAQQAAGKSAATIRDVLVERFMRHSGGVQGDDLTIVVAQRV